MRLATPFNWLACAVRRKFVRSNQNQGRSYANRQQGCCKTASFASGSSQRARARSIADNGRAPLPMLLFLAQHLSCSRSLSCHLTANRRTDYFLLMCVRRANSHREWFAYTHRQYIYNSDEVILYMGSTEIENETRKWIRENLKSIFQPYWISDAFLLASRATVLNFKLLRSKVAAHYFPMPDCKIYHCARESINVKLLDDWPRRAWVMSHAK